MISAFNKEFKRGFDDEVFVATDSAHTLAESTIEALCAKVPSNDKIYIKLSKIVKNRFPDSDINTIGQFGEHSPREEEDEDYTFRGRNVHLFTSLRQEEPNVCAAEDVWELLLTLDMLRQSGAEKIYLYYFYQIGQRQHKKRPHEPFTAALALRLAQTAAGGPHILRNVCLIHPHNQTSPGFVPGTKVDDFLPIAPAVLFFKSNPETKSRKLITLATDGGSEDFNRYLAKALNAHGPIVMNKCRDGLTSPESHVSAGIQYVEDDGIYICGDDIISSAETIVMAKENIENIVGHPVEFYAVATNGCFNKKNDIRAEKRIQDAHIKVLASNTIPRTEKYLTNNSNWLTVYSLAYYIADIIICNVVRKSTGVIFRRHIEIAQKCELDINDLLLNNKFPTTV